MYIFIYIYPTYNCLEYCLEFIAKHELVSPPTGCHGQLRRRDHYSGVWFIYRWEGCSYAAAVWPPRLPTARKHTCNTTPIRL